MAEQITADTVQMYVTRAITDIQKNASKKHAKLRESSKLSLDLLKRCTLVPSPGHAPDASKNVKPEEAMAEVVRTLRLACEAKSAKLVVPALDSFQKLMAFGFVQGSLTSEDGKTTRAADAVVESITSCFEVQDVGVHLQILKCLLTAVTMPGGDLHDSALMSAVRTAYNIHLISNNPVNVDTSKGILKQIVNHTFTRMEQEVAARRAARAASGSQSVSPTATPDPAISASISEDAASAAAQQQESTLAAGQPAEALPVMSPPLPSPQVPVRSEAGAKPAETPAERAAAETESSPSEAPRETEAKDAETKEATEAPKLVITAADTELQDEAKDGETATKEPSEPAPAPAPAATVEVHPPREPVSAMSPGALPPKRAQSASEAVPDEAEVLLNDCFVLFRALCKLSIKENPTTESEETEGALKSKVLALELLFDILSKCGVAFRTEPRFVEVAIKKHLRDALLQTAVSPVPRVLRFSLSIFIELLRHFKEPLKNEIGVFFSNIFLRLLESPNSTMQQKWMVLQLLHVVCKDPAQLADFYLNYDCDLQSTDIFERMVNDLSKIAQGTGAALDSWTSPSQDMALRTLGLECLVMILKSLVDWSRDLSSSAAAASASSEETTSDGAGTTTAPDAGGEQGSEEGGADSMVSESELSHFQKLKKRKAAVEEFKTRFNLAPRKGIELAVKLGLVQDTPEAIGTFLRDEITGLDKKVLGEYICGSKPLSKAVLRAFTDRCSFTGLQLDEALREFLAMFLMPGEGQVVDRVMENFGARFFKDNPNDSHFEDADAVYKLSFAIILLATDIHNPMVKNKIKFTDWVKMVNKDLAMNIEEPFLRAIHDRIAARKLELNDQGGTSGATVPDFLNPRQRREMQQQEFDKLIAKSQRDMEAAGTKRSTFFHTTRIEYVRPMFEAMWASAVVSFSILLESSDENKVIDLCLAGFKYGIRVSSLFYMETERVTFVTALGKFTLLGNLREMRPKNIAAIRTLIGVAYSEGNYLQDSWELVLNCVSQLERLHLLGSGVKPEALALPEPPQEQPVTSKSKHKATASVSFRSMGPVRQSVDITRPSGGANAAMISDIETQNSRAIMLDIDSLSIDRMYTESVSLNDPAIIDFVKALCKVSLSEISSATPRIFSLQKLVEVATYNMNRMRLVWSEIWENIKKHFILIGCSENTSVSMYAIDSLRQLSVKFLDKEELANYHFQKEFLKPFELVFASTPFNDIKELIIQCLRQIVLTRTSNIKSGWKTIFAVLSMAAEEDIAILTLGFDTLNEVMRTHFQLIVPAFFVEFINCLVSFGKNTTNADVCMKAIALLLNSANGLLQNNPPVPKVEGTGDQAGYQFTDAFQHISMWFPILTGLSTIIAHPHIDVRTEALKTLFGLLSANGQLFSPRFWELALRGVLLPIFTSVGYSRGRGAILSTAAEDSEWLATTCLNALQSLVSLLTKFFKTINFLLPDVFDLLSAFILQENSTLAGIGSTCLYQLVMDNGPDFTPAMWKAFTQLVDATCTADCDLMKHFVEAARTPITGDVRAQPEAPQAPAQALPAPAPQQQQQQQQMVATTVQLGAGTDAVITVMQQKCAACGTSETEKALLRCPLCNSEYYCSLQCQRDDWPRHQVACLSQFKSAAPSSTSPRPAAQQPPASSSSQPSASGQEIRGVGMSAKVLSGRFEIARVTIKAVEEIVYKQYAHLSTDDVVHVLGSVSASSRASQEAADSPGARALAMSAGVTDLVARKARETTLCFLRLAFFVYGADHGADYEQRERIAEEQLVPVCRAMLEAFVKTREAAMIPGRVPIVLLVLNGLAKVSDGQYRRHAAMLWPMLVELTANDNRDIRAALRLHFTRVGPLTAEKPIEHYVEPCEGGTAGFVESLTRAGKGLAAIDARFATYMGGVCSVSALAGTLEAMRLRAVLLVDEIEHLIGIGELSGPRTIVAYVTGSSSRVRRLCFAKLRPDEMGAYPSYNAGGDFNGRKYTPVTLDPISGLQELRDAAAGMGILEGTGSDGDELRQMFLHTRGIAEAMKDWLHPKDSCLLEVFSNLKRSDRALKLMWASLANAMRRAMGEAQFGELLESLEADVFTPCLPNETADGRMQASFVHVSDLLWTVNNIIPEMES
eukprot:m51a1_g9999 putative brefeldin a-inhibited guanine nucleotide-exchange protein 2 (2110) ;mRNA; r:66982-74852